jgi:ribosomal protein S18 acetylase RimI-like enzyme
MRIYQDNAYSPAQGAVLLNGLNEASAKAKGMRPVEPFGFFIKDDDGQVVGGVMGARMFGSLHTDILWVDERLRNQGWGTKLMAEAEALGKASGCSFATVSTMDWEALSFYQRLGYSIEFTRTGYEKNSTMYLLRKSLLGLKP